MKSLFSILLLTLVNSISIPLWSNYDDNLVFNSSIGTPGKTISLGLSSNVENSWLWLNNTNDKYFKPYLSKSFTKNEGVFTTRYNNYILQGTYGSDIWNLTSDLNKFGLINSSGYLSQVDGYLGLSLSNPDLSINRYINNNNLTSVIGLITDSKISQLTIGETISPKLIKKHYRLGNINHYQLQQNSGWNINIKTLSTGDFKSDLIINKSVIINPEVNYLYFPTELYINILVNILGESLSCQISDNIISCNNNYDCKYLPDIELNLINKNNVSTNLVINNQNYQKQLNNGCQILIKENNNNNDIILGKPFLNSYYLEYYPNSNAISLQEIRPKFTDDVPIMASFFYIGSIILFSIWFSIMIIYKIKNYRNSNSNSNLPILNQELINSESDYRDL